MPAPSSKDRKAAIDRTPITITKVGYVNKRRPGHSGDNRKKPLTRSTDKSLRRK